MKERKERRKHQPKFKQNNDEKTMPIHFSTHTQKLVFKQQKKKLKI